MEKYDWIGRGYASVRRADPRLAAPIWSALGDAQIVVNVGAGTGSYEPSDRFTVAVEPSYVMISQRAEDAAPAVNAVAEALPLGDRSVDAALGVFTIHHWNDLETGLGEMLRVARRRIVLLTMEVDAIRDLWIVRDYLPETLAVHADAFPTIDWLLETLPNASVETIPVPHDCTDGFMAAFWARPEAYLDPEIRKATSAWHQLPPEVTTRALTRLQEDLDGREWDRRYGHLRNRRSLDVGLRLVCSELL